MAATAERRVVWLRRLVGLSWLALCAASWPLWTAAGEFPGIPWLRSLTSVPTSIDRGLLGLLLAAASLAVIGPSGERWTRRVSGGLWLTSSGLLLLDQHRLQPWAYQFWLLLAVLSLTNGEGALRYGRILAISVYVWSAASKLDPGFVAGHGQMLLEGWARSLGGDLARWSDATRTLAAWSLPAGELLTAGLLAWRPTRLWGTSLSLVLHGQLLLAVGPWGLNHEPGVLLWNVYFMLQNLLLFPLTQPTGATPATCPIAPDSKPAGVLVAAAVIAPALNPLGWWDHWPSWSVYSAHPAIVRVYVDDADVARLPAALQALTLPPEPLQTWRQVRLDQWSFAARHVPPYPQERWKLALAAAVAERYGLKHRLRVEVLSRRGWWTMERDVTHLTGAEEVRMRLRSSLFNVSARRDD